MKFIVSIPPMVIPAKNAQEAKTRFLRKVGIPYTKFIKVSDYDCSECGRTGNMHDADCGKRMFFY